MLLFVRQAFAHDTALQLAPGGDDGAPGAAITVGLCGHWEHEGRLRDFVELAGYDSASYCSGEATRWGGDEVTPFQTNFAVVVAGVGIVPGQRVFADSSAAVVIPDRQLDEVLATARRVEAEDAGFRDQIAWERR